MSVVKAAKQVISTDRCAAKILRRRDGDGNGAVHCRCSLSRCAPLLLSLPPTSLRVSARRCFVCLEARASRSASVGYRRVHAPLTVAIPPRRHNASSLHSPHKNSAPAALGPYSQAIRAGSTLYVSGQIGLVPGTKDFAGDGVEAQAEQVMKNMGAILEAAGASYKHVVKTTILLAGECWERCGA